MHKFKSIAIVGALTAGAVAAAHAQNLVANGDFTANASLFAYDNVGIANGPNTPSANPSTIPGWDLLYQTYGWYYYGINGPLTGVTYPNYWGPATPGGLTYMFEYPGGANASQNLSLAANTTYNLSYQVGASQWNPGACTYGVTIADGAATYYTASAVANSLAFDTITTTFTTPATITGTPVINLEDVAGPYSSAVDFANVSITPVPEPTTIALAGLGGLASLVALRRRNK
jgi:hypothetical protein